MIYERWPGLTPEKLESGLRADERNLNESGYEARIGFVDHGETAASAVESMLAERVYDCILIGAGVRTDPEEFTLFETLVNVIHAKAPQAKICFNTGPADSVAAVKRWV